MIAPAKGTKEPLARLYVVDQRFLLYFVNTEFFSPLEWGWLGVEIWLNSLMYERTFIQFEKFITNNPPYNHPNPFNFWTRHISLCYSPLA